MIVLLKAFDLFGFLLNSTEVYVIQRQYPTWGGFLLNLKPYNLRAVLSGIRQSLRHSKHDCFLASSILTIITDSFFCHFTELRTINMVLFRHVGVLEILSPLTQGQVGTSPTNSNDKFYLLFFLLVVRFYCIFLYRLYGNKAHISHYRQTQFMDNINLRGEVYPFSGV